MKIKKINKIRTLKYCFIIILFTYIFSHIDKTKLLEALLSVRWEWYLLALALMFLRHFISAIGTYMLTKSVNMNISFKLVFSTMLHSFFFSTIGAWLGGIARWRGLTGPDQRRGEAFFVILADNLYTLTAFSVMFFTFFMLEGHSRFSAAEKSILVVYSAGIIICSCLSVLCFYANGLHRYLVKLVTDWSTNYKWLISLKNKILDSLRVWRIAKNSGKDTFVAGIFIIYAFSGIFSLKMMAAAAGVEISWLCAGWLCALPRMIQLVPLTIAGIGITEGVFVFGLSKYGIEPEKSLLLGLLVSFGGIISAIAGGILYLIQSTGNKPKIINS